MTQEYITELTTEYMTGEREMDDLEALEEYENDKANS